MTIIFDKLTGTMNQKLVTETFPVFACFENIELEQPMFLQIICCTWLTNSHSMIMKVTLLMESSSPITLYLEDIKLMFIFQLYYDDVYRTSHSRAN